MFDILRQAGVRTAWLSNQEASGFYGSIGRTLGGRCDVMQFTSHLSHSIDLSERYDEELLPLLDGVLAEQPEEGVPYVIGADTAGESLRTSDASNTDTTFRTA